ncbi:MAG: gamma-glutamyl-gamma-aminobutyrate hydrolase family protein [Candidatus Pacearchaeota archaeon]
MKVLIISTCKEKLHEFEFVEPIKNILKEKGFDFFVKSYREICEDDFNNCDKIIISGTSLMDNDFLNYIERFNLLKDTEKPILGICAGMQILGLLFGGKIKKKTEIGLLREKFSGNFLGLEGEKEVWHLHNNYVNFDKNWKVFCYSGTIQKAVKHKKRKIYCCLFHPEVRNREAIRRFLMVVVHA